MKDRINFIIQQNEISKTKFAERLNVSPAFVSQMCAGARDPSDRTIKDICREFHVNENWLRTGVGSMKAKTTQREKIANFFTDVLSTAPDERSALIAALDDMPPEFWPLVVELAKNITANYKKEED